MSNQIEFVTVDELCECYQSMLISISRMIELGIDTKSFLDSLPCLTKASYMVQAIQERKLSDEQALEAMDWIVRMQNALILGGFDVRSRQDSELTKEMMDMATSIANGFDKLHD